MRWFRVYREGDNVVLSVFPHEPGGTELHLTEEVALWLASRLKEEAEKNP